VTLKCGLEVIQGHENGTIRYVISDYTYQSSIVSTALHCKILVLLRRHSR